MVILIEGLQLWSDTINSILYCQRHTLIILYSSERYTLRHRLLFITQTKLKDMAPAC